ncbi:Rv0361 family membrane protein [Mycolicibacterium thermoresistibile]
MAGPYPYPDQFPAGRPPAQDPADAAVPYPETAGSAYPGMLPPPVQYPRRRRWRRILAVLAVVAVIVGAGTAVVLATRGGGGAAGGSAGLTEAAAQAEIQRYLDALADGDDETVARHALCGMFDEVKQRRTDLEVAALNSDAFRKQYDRAEVTSIDKMVRLSVNQARVLFSMRGVPAGGTSAREPAETEVQGIAELLYQDNEILVCNYLVRTGGQY